MKSRSDDNLNWGDNLSVSFQRSAKITLVLFFTVFSFSVPIFGHSYFIFSLLLLVRVAFFKGGLRLLARLYRKKIYLLTISIFLITSIVVLYWPITLGVYDQFEFFKKILLHIIYFLFVPIIICYLDFNKVSVVEFIKFLLYAFLMQSMIQIVAYAFPDFREIIHYTYSSDIILKSKEYGYLRAVALFSDPFFTLSCLYSVCFVLFFQYLRVSNRRNATREFLLFILLLGGSFFAGRTALIGVFFGFILIILHSFSFSAKVAFQFLFLSIILGLISLLLLPESIVSTVTKVVIPRAFSFIYAYFETGSVHTHSTSTLVKMLEANVSAETLLHGDGRFTDSHGLYYMDNDSGYFRNVYYFGIVPTVLTIILNAVVFYYPATRIYNLNKTLFKDFFILASIIMLMQLFIHIKGMFLFSNRPFYLILMLLSYFYIKSASNSKI